MNWYFQPFMRYAEFSGRARRKEYWTFALGNVIIAGILGAVGKAAGMVVLPGVFSLLIFIPTFAVLVRRLHDVGKRGGFILIGMIPLIGPILLFIQLIKDGDYNDNKFGSNPKKG